MFTRPSNVLPLHLKQTFPPIIWIFIKGEGDGIESRLPFKICSTLLILMLVYSISFYWSKVFCQKWFIAKKREIFSVCFEKRPLIKQHGNKISHTQHRAVEVWCSISYLIEFCGSSLQEQRAYDDACYIAPLIYYIYIRVRFRL